MSSSFPNFNRHPTSGQVPPVSVIILAWNEEVNIADCLRSCAWCDDVHILDSGSTDRTCQIAKAMGAHVHMHPFQSFGQQRNWAIDNIPCKHEWHFHLDADERFVPELVSELAEELGTDGQRSTKDAYLCSSKMIFQGKWLKRSGGYPAYQVRLFHSKRCRFIDFGHGQREKCDGEVGRLRHAYLHYNFSKGVLEWLNKHNSYSEREAAEGLLILRDSTTSLSELFGGDPMHRRRAIKNLSYRLPERALWRFVHLYFGRFGFLDGLAGLHYCAMVSMYDYWTELKIKERASAWSDTSFRCAARLVGELPVAPSSRVNVLIPTRNESVHIADVVRNALSLGPVFVLDSLSTDGTQELARQAGAVVIEHPFEDYAAQKNWGLDNIPFSGDWVFILDADERITPALRDEVLRVVAEDSPVCGYYVNRVLVFMGRFVRHGGLYPSWNLRFFRRGKARYEDRVVHEHMVCDGPTQYLRSPMCHIRAESVQQYLAKHIRYADMESTEWGKRQDRHCSDRETPVGSLFRDVLLFRQWFRRNIWPRLPFAPMIRFLYMYIIRGGFFDGKAGWHLAHLMASYEYMIRLLCRDKLRRKKPDARSNCAR